MFGRTTHDLSAADATPGPGAGWYNLPRLGLMMFLQLGVFGSWFVTFGLVLASHGQASLIGTCYALAAIAALLSPLFVGAICDRFYSAEKVLGLLHLTGAGIMLMLPPAVLDQNGFLVGALVFLYTLFFMPTLGLANTVGLRHVDVARGENAMINGESRYPFIRVLGTTGWLSAGMVVGALGLSGATDLFYFTAAISAVLGFYAFTLPSTPPALTAARLSLGDLVAARSFGLFRIRNYTIFMICAVLISISLGVYNAYASSFLRGLGIENVAGVLAIGQASELAFIAAIPWVLAHLGMKRAMFLGMVCWSIRFVFFVLASHGYSGFAIPAVILHGVCADLFIVVGVMYLCHVAPDEVAAQAQNAFILVVSGVGPLIGSMAAGAIHAAAFAEAPSDMASWAAIWWLPAVAAGLAAVIWGLMFRDPKIAVTGGLRH